RKHAPSDLQSDRPRDCQVAREPAGSLCRTIDDSWSHRSSCRTGVLECGFEEDRVQTAFSITDVTFGANPVAPGVVVLSVDFRLFNNGPSHIAGLVATTDFWVTSNVVPAKFQSFGAGFEFWHASFQVA